MSPVRRDGSPRTSSTQLRRCRLRLPHKSRARPALWAAPTCSPAGAQPRGQHSPCAALLPLSPGMRLAELPPRPGASEKGLRRVATGSRRQRPGLSPGAAGGCHGRQREGMPLCMFIRLAPSPAPLRRRRPVLRPRRSGSFPGFNLLLGCASCLSLPFWSPPHGSSRCGAARAHSNRLCSPDRPLCCPGSPVRRLRPGEGEGSQAGVRSSQGGRPTIDRQRTWCYAESQRGLTSSDQE